MRSRWTAASAGLALAALGFPSSVLAQDGPDRAGAPITQAQAHAECYCRAQGRIFAVGESTCLRTASGPRLAECGMVLNNTSWQFTERPCPES
jgi:hypothetical protein